LPANWARVYNSITRQSIVLKSCLNQGCGAGAQISGSCSSSGHPVFLAPVATSSDFWLWIQNNLVQKTEKTLHYLYNSLEPEPKFQALTPSKECLASAPAILNCSSSTRVD